MLFGSTVQPLSKRLATHKKDYKRFNDGKRDRPTTVFQIFDEYGYENCKVELAELFPCSTKEELHKREGEYMRNNECVNKFIPGRTRKEYQQANLDRAVARQRKCRANFTEEQKEAIKEQQRQYREEHKDHIRDRTKQHKADHEEQLRQMRKKYIEEHKDEIKTKSKMYREANSDKIKQYYEKNREVLKAKYTCEICGSAIANAERARHSRTTKHILALENSETSNESENSLSTH